ncbi:response regulator [candidate division KSB1 bacterium]|nr:response regulator [candidate division KSB1 bacterium]
MATRSADEQPTILIVDRDFKQALASKNMLESQGYRIMCTHSGREALELCAKERIDLVVTESLLSDMPGLDFIEALAARREKIPIVMNTNHPGDSQDFRTWAADAIVHKSSGTRALSTKVASLLQQRYIH